MNSTRVWRIIHKDYAGKAFSGEGARIYGGRFNSEGRSAVYTSGSLSLSLLEMLVQTNDRHFFSRCVLLHADIPHTLIREVTAGDLPPGWDSVPYNPVSQNFGDEWIINQFSAVLKVPSVLVPVEYNYIINPHHPDIGQINYSEPNKFSFDRRLFEFGNS